MRILVTGATGYVGGRLIPELLSLGHKVSVFVRDIERVKDREWFPQVHCITGDLTAKGDWAESFTQIDVAYYLVHSMNSHGDFEKNEKLAVNNFVEAAKCIKHIIYLGGIISNDGRSKHLSSRAETGNILRENLPTTEFRAGPVIGSGSASFEMIRYLTERLPIMVAPKWINNIIQPIAIRDVLSYLVSALDIKAAGVVDIATERLTFKQMLLNYAKVRGLRRFIIPVPVLTPHLAGLWVGLVTPIQNRLAIPLIKGITQDLKADTQKAQKLFPNISPLSYEEAVKRALDKVYAKHVETHWSGALTEDHFDKLFDEEGACKEVRIRNFESPVENVFKVISQIGGDNGWYTWNRAWKLRGFLDKCIGGPGLRRGRRDPYELRVGDAIDFWRVEKIQKNQSLILRAEMKVPGKAWLKWELQTHKKGCKLRQTAIFHPKGLFGTLYWYSLYPTHKFIFSDLIEAIGKRAEEI